MDECECLPLPTDCHLPLTFSSSYGQCCLPVSSYCHTLSSSSNFLFFFWTLSSSCECRPLPTHCHLPITSSSFRGHCRLPVCVFRFLHTLSVVFLLHTLWEYRNFPVSRFHSLSTTALMSSSTHGLKIPLLSFSSGPTSLLNVFVLSSPPRPHSAHSESSEVQGVFTL